MLSSVTRRRKLILGRMRMGEQAINCLHRALGFNKKLDLLKVIAAQNHCSVRTVQRCAQVLRDGELAERVGMSRSSFAQKFKETVGESPIGYLTRWRMLLAGDRLVNSSEPVAAISLSLGYDSESRVQHRLQESHGLFAAPVRPCPEFGRRFALT